MYCVIQEVENKRQKSLGPHKEIISQTINNFFYDSKFYSWSYGEERFERPIKKAYKISIHKSYRENGKVKKKQWHICTMGYYDLIEFSVHDIAGNRINALSEDIGVSEDDLYKLIYEKLDKLIEQAEGEHSQTEEYKTSIIHSAILATHREKERVFNNKYGEDTYKYCYDVFGNLRNKEKLKELQEEYERQQEYQRSYYESYKSNYNNSHSSYFENNSSNYTEEDKPKLKQMYKALAKTFHPDKTNDNGDMMKLVNRLKEEWGV